MTKRLKIANIQEEVLKEVLFLLKEKFISEQSAAPETETVKEIIPPDAGTLINVEPSGDPKAPLLIFLNPSKEIKNK
jgi:hypothetical protein